MDIHKPKPWRGGPEFLKEIGTIVIGVLIALGGEQAVEWLHHDAELRDTREALMKEIATNVRRADFSAREDRCVFGALDRYVELMRAGRPRPPLPWVNPLYTTTIWDASQSGAATRMPLEEKFRLATFYESVRGLQGFSTTQRAQMTHGARYLSVLDLTPAEVREVVMTVSEQQTILRAKIANEKLLVQQAAALGVHPTRVSASAEQSAIRACELAGLAPPRFDQPLSPPAPDAFTADIRKAD